MKKFYLLLTTLLVVATVWSQKIWIGSASGGSWNTATNWSPTGVPAANDIVVFNSGVSGTITNVASAASLTLGGLVVSGNSNIVLQHTAGRTLTIANGANASDLEVDAGSQLTIGTNINITLATAAVVGTIDGVLTINTGRTYDANNAGNATTVNGTLQNSGTVSSTSTTLTFASGGKYEHNQNGGNIPLASWNGASTCEVRGATTTEPGNMDQAFGNFTWNCASQGANQLQLPATGMSISGTFSIASTGTTGRIETNQTPFSVGKLDLSGGTLRIGSNTARTLTVTGDASISGGTLLMTSGNSAGTLNVAGNFTQSGGTIDEGGTGNGNINFNGSSAQTFSKTGGTITNTINYAINSGATVNFGTSVLNGSAGTFTLNAGAKIITANSNGLGATGSIQVTGTKTFNSGADYEFRGASTGVFTTSTNPQVRNFTVNNSGGNVTLAQPMTVNGTLTLSDGLLTTTATNLLTINNAGSATAPTSTSFVDGPLAKIGNTDFTFPVGKSGNGFRQISLVGLTGANITTTVFRAEFFRGNPPAGTVSGGIARVSSCEYWDLTRTAGPGSARVKITWESGSPCNGAYVTQMSSLVVAHLTAGTWSNEGQQAVNGSNTSGDITSNNVLATFSPFALATINAAANPLPVLFADVRAYEKNGGVQIEWSNLTERDLSSYSVEYSTNGRDFATIDKLLPKNNQNDRADYTDFHASPVAGANFYRIKALEVNGKLIYSKVLRVEKGRSGAGFTLYPNPVTGKQITLALTGVQEGSYNVRIVNSTGQNVYQKNILTQGSGVTQTLDLSSSVKPGIYTLFVSGANYSESKLFVVQ